MIRKILCFIGWHEWTWNASDFEDQFNNPDWEYYLMSEEPPSFAKCKYCGEIYGD